MNALDDSSLATRAGEDPQAFAAIFDRYYAAVFNYVRYRCDDDATADDVTALVFEKLMHNIGRYDPEKGAFPAWLFAVARNAVNDHWRKARRQKWVSLDFLQGAAAPEPSPEAGLVHAEEESALLAAVGHLPARERDVLGLKFAAGLTNREIARTTGLQESHIGVIVHRSLAQLRTKLHSLLGETL